ncbi:MAG: hypothetical protein ABF296_08185 [Oceanococcaceae bacterium]
MSRPRAYRDAARMKRTVVDITALLERRSEGAAENRIADRRPLDDCCIDQVWAQRKKIVRGRNRVVRARRDNPGPEAA